jgi:DNA-binding transcriptional MocR family regulator
MAVGRKPYKAHKRGAGRHVQLSEYLQATEAWASLKPGPRALYVELKRRFNGSNNGQFFLSQRDAAKALNVTKDTVTGYFKELSERGFITTTQGGHLGPSGIGQAAKYALQEEPLHGKPAAKGFIAWRRKTKACPENQESPPQ